MSRRGTLLSLLACLEGFAAPASAATFSAELPARLQRNGRAAVVVALRRDAAARETGSMAKRRAKIARQRNGILRAVQADELTVLRAYEAVAGFAAVVSEAGLAQLASHPDVQSIDLDAQGGGALARSVRQIRADRVHVRGITGTGTTIAVLDTGVDATHPDLADALVHEECFCANECCPGGATRSSGPGSAATRHRHGTHVAGIAVSRGRIAPRGVAPGANLVAVRVLDDDNRGELSDWLAGLDWIAAYRPDVRVVNMSLASDEWFSVPCDRDCEGQPLCAENMLFRELITLLYQRGTLVFAAAGNDRKAHALTSPACVEPAIAVGAVDAADQVASFSNGGPLLDLLAPGVGILSDGLNSGLAFVSGTSMATPHAAGVAALLLAARPGSSAEGIETAMRETGRPITDSRNGRVTPRVDALAALNTAAEGSELLAGGGSRTSDCLLEWNFIPPDIAHGGGLPSARCSDNDPACDADDIDGRCTFSLSLCFNAPDPLLPRCDIAEPVQALTIHSPDPDAPRGSLERLNADNLRQALPALPVATSSVCSVPFPFVVQRSDSEPGLGAMRLTARTATRTDYDRIALVCGAP